MAAYSVTTYSNKGAYDAVLAALETELETVNDGKTIRYVDIIPRGNEFVGILIYDT
ncbi:hypothetical protein LCGC14_1544290 [marine sediment metagenome]|uniref:ABM domain-containing protein n=1 Tax=marine sediment metagenome TaxID=412755 RepID=A0A0F9IS69_9ZZZZ